MSSWYRNFSFSTLIFSFFPVVILLPRKKKEREKGGRGTEGLRRGNREEKKGKKVSSLWLEHFLHKNK